MLFAVYALDNPSAGARRQAVHAEHVAHLKAAKDQGVTITVGGPLMADDGTTSIGSLMVIEAPDRADGGKIQRRRSVRQERHLVQGRNPALRPPDVKQVYRSSPRKRGL